METQSIELFKYFEEKADKLKAQLIQLITLITGFMAALLAWALKAGVYFQNCVLQIPNKINMLGASIAGFALVMLGFILINEHGHHINRNFERSAAARMPESAQLESIWKANNIKAIEAMPAICKKLQLLMTGFGILFLLLFAISLAGQNIMVIEK